MALPGFVLDYEAHCRNMQSFTLPLRPQIDTNPGRATFVATIHQPWTMANAQGGIQAKVTG
jgi:hypothetical protein